MLRLPCPKALGSATMKSLTRQAVTFGHQWTRPPRCRAGEPCPTCIHVNEHMTPHGMSNTHTAIGNQSKVFDANMLTLRRPMDAVKWHNTQMTVAVSHLYTSLESMIVSMLPSLKPDFAWIFADELYIVHNGLLPSIEVPIHWHQYCHDKHVSGEVIQAVQTLRNDLRMQTRSLADWEPTRKIVLQTCKHISFALIGLLFPCAVTAAVQLVHAATLISIMITLLQLTKAKLGSVCSAQICITFKNV